MLAHAGAAFFRFRSFEKKLSFPIIRMVYGLAMINALSQRIFLLIAAFLPLADAADDTPLFLPFSVSVGEQQATVTGKMDLFATLERPVELADPLVIGKEAPQLIVNAFECLPDGTVLEQGAPVIWFQQTTDTIALDAPMQGRLESGKTYLLNIVAHNTTARLVMTIDKEGGVKLPDFEAIAKFLRRVIE